MNDRIKRSCIRFLKIFSFSFLATFVYLASPIIDSLSVGFSFSNIFMQLLEIAKVAGIAGFVGAIEKYASWKERLGEV